MADIGASCGCNISGFKTLEGTVFFWGCVLWTGNPGSSCNSTLQLFACLDTPVMLKPLELELRAPAWVDKFKQSFDIKVLFLHY